MKRAVGLSGILVTAILAFGGCSLASGIKLRVTNPDGEAIVRLVRAGAVKEGFVSSSEWTKTHGSAVLLEMQRPSHGKARPLLLVVVRTDGATALQILRPNEGHYPQDEQDAIVRIIRGLVADGFGLKAELIAGVKVPDDLKAKL